MDSVHSIETVGLENKRDDGQNDSAKAPDGGYGWIVVVYSFFVFSVSSVNMMSFGIFITEFHSTFGWSESELGVLGALRIGLFTIAGW